MLAAARSLKAIRLEALLFKLRKARGGVSEDARWRCCQSGHVCYILQDISIEPDLLAGGGGGGITGGSSPSPSPFSSLDAEESNSAAESETAEWSGAEPNFAEGEAAALPLIGSISVYI